MELACRAPCVSVGLSVRFNVRGAVGSVALSECLSTAATCYFCGGFRDACDKLGGIAGLALKLYYQCSRYMDTHIVLRCILGLRCAVSKHEVPFMERGV